MKLQDYVFNNPILETDRLLLRPLQYYDVADLKEWLDDKLLYQYWGKRPGKSDLTPELLFQKKEQPTKSFHWGIVHKKDKKVIGEMWVYLIENDRMAKVAFRLSPICFEKTELQRLWSDVNVLNIAPYKTLEKQGLSERDIFGTEKW